MLKMTCVRSSFSLFFACEMTDLFFFKSHGMSSALMWVLRIIKPSNFPRQ